MATFFPVHADSRTLAQSGYGPALEAIAPGVSDYIANNRVDNEYWYDTLERGLAYMMLTDTQRTLLAAQVHNARLQMPPPTPADAVKKPIDLAKAASILTISSVIYNFLKG